MRQNQAAGASPPPLDVSVVIPAYNRAGLILPTLDSIAAQTYPPREVIVVDDGSTDDTADVAERWGATVIRRPNGGIGAARNTGVDAAQGAWIALLDADDLWVEDKLEWVARAVAACGDVGVVFSDMEQFDGDRVLVPSFLERRVNFAEVGGHRPEPDILCCERESLVRAFHRGNFVNPSTLVFRKDLLDVAGAVDPTLRALEDREHVLRLFKHAGVAACLRPLVRYRLHEGQFSKDAERMLKGRLQVAARIAAHPERYPHGSSVVYQALEAEAHYKLGLIYMEREDFDSAVFHLESAYRGRPSPRRAFALLIARAGPRAYVLLRQFKRRLGLPGLVNPD